MNYRLLFLFFATLFIGANGSVQLGCKSDTIQEFNGACPDGYTAITAGGCCKDADVYIIGATTIPPPTTTTTVPTTTTTASSGTCQDKVNPKTGVSDCPGMKAYCTNPTYVGLMKDQCPKTCGYCGTTDSTCQDKINPKTGTSDCPGMRNYCTNAIYHDIMKDQCPKTCGYC